MTDQKRFTMRRGLRQKPQEKKILIAGRTVTEIRQALEVLGAVLESENFDRSDLGFVQQQVEEIVRMHQQPKAAPRRVGSQIPEQVTLRSQPAFTAPQPSNPMARVIEESEEESPDDPVSYLPSRERELPSLDMFTRIYRRTGQTIIDYTGHERAVKEYVEIGVWRSQPFETPFRTFPNEGPRAGDVLRIDYATNGPVAANGTQTKMAEVRVRATGPAVIIPIQPLAYTHSNCIHQFRSSQCGYLGNVRGECNKHLDTCFMLRNTHNFSGSRIEHDFHRDGPIGGA